MFNILFKAGVHHYSYMGSTVSAGMVATFTGNRMVSICQPYQLPIGFFINSNPPEMMEAIIRDGYMSVATGPGEYETDVYEEGLYCINDLLYCGFNGRISNYSRYRGNPVIGIVNNVMEGVIGFLSVYGNLGSTAKSQYENDSQQVIEPAEESKNKFNRYTALSGREK